MLVAIVAVLALIAAVLGTLLMIGRHDRAAGVRELDQLLALPVEQARVEAEALLAKPGFFSTLAAEEALVEPRLPADVAALFARFKEVSKFEFWLGHEALQESARLPGCIKIGGDAEFEEVLVRPGYAGVWLSYPAETLGPNPEAMPSVWHKLLMVAWASEPRARG